MDSLVPVFTKNIVTFTTPWATIGSGSHYWFNTSGTITSDSSNVPASSIHGPFDLSTNGGADVCEITGYFILATTSGTGCSVCGVRVNVWGETVGQSALKDLLTVTTSPTFDTGISLANHAKQIGGMAGVAVHGSYNAAGLRGRVSKPGPFSVDVADSFPIIADSTNPTSGDVTQMSVWLLGPGVDGDGAVAINGSALSMRMFKRIWIAMKFIPTLTGGITTPAVGGGLALTGYRNAVRTDPLESNVLGVKPFGPLTTEWV